MVKYTSIRVLLALSCLLGLELEQIDVKTAFLHRELEETIYMSQPEGSIKKGDENKVCLLKKSLYGLKHLPRQWYKRFDSFMLSNSFKRSNYDCYVYMKDVKNVKDEKVVHKIYLLLYVDDMLIASKDMKAISDLKRLLGKEFDMKDLGK